MLIKAFLPIGLRGLGLKMLPNNMGNMCRVGKKYRAKGKDMPRAAGGLAGGLAGWQVFGLPVISGGLRSADQPISRSATQPISGEALRARPLRITGYRQLCVCCHSQRKAVPLT